MPGPIVTLSIAIALAAAAQQSPVAPPASGPAAPVRDPVTVRGCLEGRYLRILESDASDLSGVKRVRLKGSQSMLKMLKDEGGDYFEVSGDLDVRVSDRLDARRKVKVGNKTTVSIGAAAEQISSPEVVPPDPTLIVDAFQALGPRCPRN